MGGPFDIQPWPPADGWIASSTDRSFEERQIPTPWYLATCCAPMTSPDTSFLYEHSEARIVLPDGLGQLVVARGTGLQSERYAKAGHSFQPSEVERGVAI